MFAFMHDHFDITLSDDHIPVDTLAQDRTNPTQPSKSSGGGSSRGSTHSNRNDDNGAYATASGHNAYADQPDDLYQTRLRDFVELKRLPGECRVCVNGELILHTVKTEGDQRRNH